MVAVACVPVEHRMRGRALVWAVNGQDDATGLNYILRADSAPCVTTTVRRDSLIVALTAVKQVFLTK